MQVGVLTTDYGPHPPEKWARMTAWMIANHLIEVDEKSALAKAIEIREARDDLERNLYKVLKSHHQTVQDKERAAVAEHGHARLDGAPHAAVHDHIDVDACVEAVVDEAKLHPDLFAHFDKEEVRAMLRDRLLMDFSSVVDIERDWHANGHNIAADGRAVPNPDHDPRHPSVLAFKAARHPGAHPSAAEA
ncbi:MAG TPA: hypothetical protein VFA12_20240 [Stellaceae bacterium]|nr:hypothetical protein [Stellaceae bacterium]